MDRAEPKTLVAIATYNERDNLRPLIAEIHRFAPHVDVLVIDDNSPDGTGAIADELVREDPRVHVMHRTGKLGLGTAILAGMRYGIEKNFDILVTMDADFSHHPRDIPAVLAGMSDHEIMIGSRYVPGGGTVNWPASRRFMSWSVNTLCRTLMRLPSKDCSGGFRAYNVPLLRGTDFSNMLSRGYSFQEEVLLLCYLQGARIGETPIIFEDRRLGVTKANLKEMVRSTSILVWLGMKATLGLSKKKVRP
ncbi:MAG: polyprenol monophosphomannose synthase [Planctomycetota bacterium]